MIAIAIVRSRSGCSCCCGVLIAIVIVGSRSDCSCCCGDPVALGGKDVMVKKMLIADVSTLLLMIKDCCQSTIHDCYVVVCVSRLTLPLSDRVPVVIVPVALGG